MCLIAFAWRTHPRWRLVLVGNRDEFHARPTAPLASWDEAPQILAGRDLHAGGTWAGVAPRGRVGVITNVRDPQASHEGMSRGLLVADYLASSLPAAAHADELMAMASAYRPFNLLTFDRDDAFYLGNHREARRQRVTDGIHGVSNADFNAPWPKTQALTAKLGAWIDSDGDIASLFDLLSDRGGWPDDLLPDTGVGIERERFLASAFIAGEQYGTRASTVILVGHDDATTIIERRFGPHGLSEGETRLDLPGVPQP
ncbi:NRDE family protein [Luteibacter sp. PPL201]|uniref:NRDE family protein n=1 Tax=Luteibacter sahnii TaxID=3021977 RepID=A0ABT6BFC3_9GAMM|nr:NRDE family protein [Luteibacter sp. PPL193]MDY1549099.1 NRDE family protein [Luteibacter sp. PPL193]